MSARMTAEQKKKILDLVDTALVAFDLSANGADTIISIADEPFMQGIMDVVEGITGEPACGFTTEGMLDLLKEIGPDAAKEYLKDLKDLDERGMEEEEGKK